MRLIRCTLVAACLLLVPAPSPGADFHGFDPATYDGLMLPPEALQAMVAEAAQKSPPKNKRIAVTPRPWLKGHLVDAKRAANQVALIWSNSKTGQSRHE